jgi:hypothetical protein
LIHFFSEFIVKLNIECIDITLVVDKGTQEVYGLINYGEIWKKFGSKFDSKLGLHLQQLVNFGYYLFN